jgi:uncharacterized protein (TIGR00251 family)
MKDDEFKNGSAGYPHKQMKNTEPTSIRSFMRPHDTGVYLAIKLQPRASRNEIGEALGNELRIRVTAPPVDAAANEALVRLLAEKLECPRSAVQLVRGQTSRHKTVWVNGLSPDVILQRLATR